MGLLKSLMSDLVARHHRSQGRHGHRAMPADLEGGTGQCPHCQSPCDADARFCNRCGGAIIALCSQCRNVISPLARFCSRCGSAAEHASTTGES